MDNITGAEIQNPAKANWCQMFSVVSSEGHCVPSQSKLLCWVFTDAGGPQTKRIATDVPHLIARTKYICSLPTDFGCCVADIHGAEIQRECHCSFGLDSTLLYGSLTVFVPDSPLLMPKHISSPVWESLVSELCE